MVLGAINFSKEIAESGEYFEAGEFLFSVAEILENFDYSEALKIYRQIIDLYKKLIVDFKLQAKLHEIAELYLRIADIYQDKIEDLQSEEKNIINSIKFLKQESKLLKEFDETRKLAQNYQNIAELFLKISDFKNAIKYYEKVIDISKPNNYFDMLSYSYRQIGSCYEEIDDYNKSQDIILDGVEHFSNLLAKYEEKSDKLTLSQIYQIMKNLNKILDKEEQYTIFSKKEAGAYIDLAEKLEKKEENFNKIGRYYRGAALCYQDIQNNLIECASCFLLAGNFSEKINDFNQAALNFADGANIFKEMKNFEMAYKHFVKAGDNFWKVGSINESTESYLNAYDIAVEGELEFNRFGIFNQIIRGLNKIAEEGLKNKQFFTAATLILESIKFYEQLDTAKDFLLREMVNNLYRYYYRAANLKKIGYSHIVQSYVLASISCILTGKLKKAWEIISEIDSEGNTVKKYKEIIKIMIKQVSEGKEVVLEIFPYDLRRLIESSEEITFLLKLFKGFKIK
ncbi:MAG: tetratricopeptide repeat protein [Promethearchaeota archaeon]